MTTSFKELTRIFAKIGVLSFGGPAGQIAMMHRLLVDEQKWLSDEQFLRALNFCMLLPGPEAHQLAVYAGWLLHGVRGGIMAGLLFLIPFVGPILMVPAASAGGLWLVCRVDKGFLRPENEAPKRDSAGPLGEEAGR